MLQPSRRLGDRYRLDARIGAGGMGEVWRATDEVLDRVVAVKIMLAAISADPPFARRFLTEAKAMAGVNHPAVAAIHDYGTSDGSPFLVMEFVDGQSLAQMLAGQGRLSAAQTMHLIAQAADGLQAVHDRGIVHRDVKPANLLVRRDGSLLLTDFGIARIEGATPLTTAGAILGTPTYLAPEQVLGQPATALSDVYSLGLTASECLAGRRPFTGDNPYAVALQRIQGAPRTLAGDLPGPVLAVVERALAPEPGDRWPSAAAFAAAARSAGAGIEAPEARDAPGAGVRGPASPEAGAVRAAPRRQSRRAVLPAVIAALAVVLSVGGTLAWRTLGSGADPVNGSASGPGRNTVAGPRPAPPQDFGTCDAGLCPTTAMCWGGTVAISGRAMPPGDADCAGDHYWETFAALPMPAGATAVRQDQLMDRPDVAAACSAEVMAGRSTGPHVTTGWRRDAWPLQAGNDWVLLCIAGPVTGESKGSVFRPVSGGSATAGG